MAKVTVGPGGKLLMAGLGIGLAAFAVIRWKDKIAPDRPRQGTVTAGDFPRGRDGGVGTSNGAANGTAAGNSHGPNPMAGRDLDRPLRVAINTWGGYAGGLVANNGLHASPASIFSHDHGIQVEMVKIDAPEDALAAFRAGTIDVNWTTVDAFAQVYPALESQYHPVAFMQFDFSHGGDAIAVSQAIHQASDLRGKRIAFAQGSPSQYFLLYVLTQAGLSNADITPVYSHDAIEAANTFKAGAVDACVSWAPDVFNAAHERQGGHILTSTREATSLIADMFYARREFITQHPDTMARFVAGWMDGVRAAHDHPDHAAEVLAPALSVSVSDARDMIGYAELTDYWANRRFFELDGDIPVGFDDIFNSASILWRRVNLIQSAGQSVNARDTRVLEGLRAQMGAPPAEAVAAAQTVGGTFAAAPTATQTAVVTRHIPIFFATGSAALDPNAEYAVSQAAELAATFGGAQMRIVGNTDDTGNATANRDLSRRRAQAVADALVNRYHFAANKFTVVGNGPDNPVAPNTTDNGRQQNRRTDFEILSAPADPSPAPAAPSPAPAAH